MRGKEQWAFMRIFTIVKDAGLYLWRLRILETPLFGTKLHAIWLPDPDLDRHDHPWWFFSIVLWGYYYEEVPKNKDGPWWDVKVRKVRWFNFKRATDSHRIIWISKRPVVTLVFNGPWNRIWGFVTPGDKWVRYEDYLGLPREDAA